MYAAIGYTHATAAWLRWRIREAVGRRLGSENGQGTVEYVGLILLVSLLMVGMVAAMKGFNRPFAKTRYPSATAGRPPGSRLGAGCRGSSRRPAYRVSARCRAKGRGRAARLGLGCRRGTQRHRWNARREVEDRGRPNRLRPRSARGVRVSFSVDGGPAQRPRRAAPPPTGRRQHLGDVGRCGVRRPRGTRRSLGGWGTTDWLGAGLGRELGRRLPRGARDLRAVGIDLAHAP
jgi:hypothetical protein